MDETVLDRACVRWGCYRPPDHKFHRMMSETPACVRAYYEQLGIELHDEVKHSENISK